MAAGRGDQFFQIAAVVLFLVFAALVMNHACFFTMDADEAFNAGIAKNWLAGYGYSSSLGVIFPFDAYISSGPAYTFLQAIPIVIFGNDADVQKPFIALVNLLLLGNVFRLLRQQAASSLHFFIFLVFCLSSYALLEFKFWHRPAGELLSFLYFVNGVLLLQNSIRYRQSWVSMLAGLFVSCAYLTKAQAALWVAGLFFGLLLLLLRTRTQELLRLLCVFFVAFCVPVLAWQLYKFLAMAALEQTDPQLYQYAIGKDWHFFSTHGSGMYFLWEIDSWRDALQRVSSTGQLAFGKFCSIFSAYGIANRLYAVTLPLLTLAMLLKSFRSASSLQLLIFPLLFFLLWAFFLNNSVYTHQMLPGIWLWVLLLGVMLVRYPLVLGALGLINVAVLAGHALHYTKQDCFLTRGAACVYMEPNPVRHSLRDALAYVQQNQLPGPLTNCGWYFAQDIEFSLPGVNNIQDCMRLFDDGVEFDRRAFIQKNNLPESFNDSRTTDDLIKIYVNKRKNLFGGNFVAPIIWKKPLEFTYISGIYMEGDSLEQKRNVMSFLSHCRDVLFKNQFYSIRHCSYDDLQEYINEWGGLPIFTHNWEAMYYADFMYTTKVLHKNPVHMRPY